MVKVLIELDVEDAESSRWKAPVRIVRMEKEEPHYEIRQEGFEDIWLTEKQFWELAEQMSELLARNRYEVT